MLNWNYVCLAVAVHAQSKILVQQFAASRRSIASANELMNGLVAINDQGLPSGVEIGFRPPTTAAD